MGYWVLSFFSLGCLVNMAGGTNYAYRTLVVSWKTDNFS
jgi:hypothetical protein